VCVDTKSVFGKATTFMAEPNVFSFQNCFNFSKHPVLSEVRQRNVLEIWVGTYFLGTPYV
jgi:hypothetical protein